MTFGRKSLTVSVILLLFLSLFVVPPRTATASASKTQVFVFKGANPSTGNVIPGVAILSNMPRGSGAISSPDGGLTFSLVQSQFCGGPPGTPPCAIVLG
ncbi:MAG: hypothetical protein ACHQ1H_08765 [Nitrososphaerales archaeon]